jgi:hypothetical protein
MADSGARIQTNSGATARVVLAPTDAVDINESPKVLYTNPSEPDQTIAEGGNQ